MNEREREKDIDRTTSPQSAASLPFPKASEGEGEQTPQSPLSLESRRAQRPGEARVFMARLVMFTARGRDGGNARGDGGRGGRPDERGKATSRLKCLGKKYLLPC